MMQIREGFQCQALPKSWHCQNWLNPPAPPPNPGEGGFLFLHFFGGQIKRFVGQFILTREIKFWVICNNLCNLPDAAACPVVRYLSHHMAGDEQFVIVIVNVIVNTIVIIIITIIIIIIIIIIIVSNLQMTGPVVEYSMYET